VPKKTREDTEDMSSTHLTRGEQLKGEFCHALRRTLVSLQHQQGDLFPLFEEMNSDLTQFNLTLQTPHSSIEEAWELPHSTSHSDDTILRRPQNIQALT